MIYTKDIKRFICSICILSIFFTIGCGGSGGSQDAPDGSTVEILPSGGYSATYPDDRCFPFFVVVRDPDGNPIPSVSVTVWSAFAIHSVYSPTLVYQLYDSEFCTSGTQMDNFHTDMTENDGIYTFSALVTTGTPTFTDTMRARAGTATDGVDFKLE